MPFLVKKPISLKCNTYYKGGHWTQKEKLKFTIFMDFHKEVFLRKQNRRMFKIFKIMAEFMKTRTAGQCRSHHQKMEKQFVSIETFVKKVRRDCTKK